MAGIQDSKTVDGVTYNYLTLGGKVVRQTWGSNVLDIIYDNSGLPYAFKYNGGYYIYVLNQHGDVIRIVNSTVDWIENDLAENPLAEGEQLNLIGYSGGGQVALNVVEKLSYKVDNVILIGAPVFEIFTADASVLVIDGGWDPLSIPGVLTGKMTTYLAGWYSHEGYFNKANIDTTARIVADFLSR